MYFNIQVFFPDDVVYRIVYPWIKGCIKRYRSACRLISFVVLLFNKVAIKAKLRYIKASILHVFKKDFALFSYLFACFECFCIFCGEYDPVSDPVCIHFPGCITFYFDRAHVSVLSFTDLFPGVQFHNKKGKDLSLYPKFCQSFITRFYFSISSFLT